MELVLLFGNRIVLTKEQHFNGYADDILTHCASFQFKPACYDVEIPKLMDAPARLSMEDAFAVTKFVQEKDPEYLYCHVLGHKLSYKETSKDVSKWKDVVARCPTTMCNNGCQHGALMRRFNTETLTQAQIETIRPDLENVCEPRNTWNPVEVERSMCYHAIGHLAMFVTGGKVAKSVDLCNKIGKKADGRTYTQTCTEGVLMTIFQPLEPEDKALVKDIAPSKETVNAFCEQYKGEAFDACHRESWPLFLDDIQKPQGLLSFCSYTTNHDARWTCIATAMNILTVYKVIGNDMKLDVLNGFCNALGKEESGWCYGFAAARLIQIDPRYQNSAFDICKTADRSGDGKTCYESVIELLRTSFHPNSQELKNACSHIPKVWRSECLMNR